MSGLTPIGGVLPRTLGCSGGSTVLQRPVSEPGSGCESGPIRPADTPLARGKRTARPSPWGPRPSRQAESARLAVDRVTTVPRAELLELQAVGVVPAVLARDVVALLALRARRSDLRPDVSGLA